MAICKKHTSQLARLASPRFLRYRRVLPSLCFKLYVNLGKTLRVSLLLSKVGKITHTPSPVAKEDGRNPSNMA